MDVLLAIGSAAIGAAAAIVASLITSKRAREDAQAAMERAREDAQAAMERAREDARADMRRAAYSAFIESHEDLYQRVSTPETVESAARRGTVGELIGSGVGSTSRTLTAVLLTGSEDAVAKAQCCQEEAWKIYDLFFPGDEPACRHRSVVASTNGWPPAVRSATSEPFSS